MSSTATATPASTSVDTTVTAHEALGDNMFAHTKKQLDILGKPVQKLVQGIEELGQLGVETKDIPLPKIIVVGDQSAGKSSLIEGISGITVPRSHGTCTRCPLQITLLHSKDDIPWSCTVSLQKKYTYRPDASLSQGRYGKWQEDSTIPLIPFAVVKDKTELEDVIRRAQWATLNPTDNPEEYLTKKYFIKDKLPDLALQVDFSPNRVVLDITAPFQPALSFIDLPGIIRQTEATEDKWLVGLVENFVTDYIKQGNSLILLARSMESDFANSSSAAIVETCDAFGRTVGCLTKPDRYDKGAPVKPIHNVLSGKAFQVGHGYFITRQPSQEELTKGITFEGARELEDSFFAKAPWSTELGAFQERFGTMKLRDSLSMKLTDQIRASLPAITDKVNDRLGWVENELISYPDPPINAQGRVLEALNVFGSSVEKHVEGTNPSFNQLRNSLKDLSNNFLESLVKLRPGLIVKTPEEFRQVEQAPMISLVSDDEADGETTPCPRGSQSNKRKYPPAVTPAAKKIKLDTTSRGSPAPATASTPGKKRFRLSEIRETLNSLTSSNVANEIDPRAVDHLRKATLQGLEQPMVDFIDQVNRELHATLGRLLQEACVKWIATTFFEEASKIVRSFVSRAMAEQLASANRDLGTEQLDPITMDIEILNYHVAKEREALEEGRTTQRAYEELESADIAAGRMLIDKDERKRKAKTDMKLRAELGEDMFDNEIKVMASVRGYYNLAMMRFVDRIVQGVRVEVLHKLVTDLPDQLSKGLGVEDANAQDHCTSLLAEDRGRETRRVELKAERNKLIQAQHKLVCLGQVEEAAALS